SSWLVGTWKIFDRRSPDHKEETVIEFREESDGISGYLIRSENKQLLERGYSSNERIFRKIKEVKYPPYKEYARGECLLPNKRWIERSDLYLGPWTYMFKCGDLDLVGVYQYAKKSN
ncbi:MAG: hypothetical protein ACRD6X_10240, partial [Pyrinomonadaceae bacterium]